ncbi:hypothetical protein GC194_13435 [bacterium]|nr:hypothetical protein [bacterium]
MHKILPVILLISLLTSCKSAVSYKGQRGLQLLKAEAVHWTTGPNGFEGITYQVYIENSRDKEVEIVGFWANGYAFDVDLHSGKGEIKLVETVSSDAANSAGKEAPPFVEDKAEGQIKYRINKKEYLWLITEFDQLYPAHEHLPE